MVDQVKIHADRATAELDLARSAACPAAARAHLALSALHLERLNLLSGRRRAPARRQSRSLFADQEGAERGPSTVAARA
jgi:hypothetical protein